MSVHEWEREREKRQDWKKKSSTIHRHGSMVPPGRGDEKFHMSLTGWSTTSDKERENWVGEAVRLALRDRIWEKRQQKVKKHPAGSMKMKLRMGDLRGGYRCGYTLISSWCVSISVITAGGGELVYPKFTVEGQRRKTRLCFTNTLNFPRRNAEVVPHLKENHANLQLGPKGGHKITFLLVSGALSVPTCCLECDITWGWEIKHRGVEHWMELLNKLDYGEYSLEFESKYRR